MPQNPKQHTAKSKPVKSIAKVGAVKPAPAPDSTETVPTKPWWQRWGRRAGRITLRSPLPEVMLIATLAMSRYLQNSDFSYPSEIVLDIVLLSIFVSVAYYIFRLVLRRRLAAHIAALFFSYSCYAFTYSFPTLHHWANKLIPDGFTAFGKAAMLVLYLAIIFGVIGFVVDKLMRSVKQLRTVPLLKIIVFAVCFIFASELGKVGLRMWTIRHDLAYKQPATSLSQDKTKITSKPNVYYLQFDRYASATTLNKIYDYDNSDLMNYLDGQGFVSRDNAYANYPFTMQSISSTLSMGYHAKLGAEFKNDSKSFQTAFPYRTILENPPVTQALKANGYNYNQVSSWWDFTRNVSTASDEPTESFRMRIFGKNFWLTDLQRDIVNKSILSPFLLKGLTIGHTTLVQYQLDRNPVQNFYAQMNAVKTIAAASATESQPQFTFAHVLVPHDPYVFDAQGNTPTYDGNRTDNGAPETTKYTNQVTYLNTQIKDLISTIRAKDPKAVIIMQSDEGPYPKQFRGTLTPGHYYNPINLPTAQMQQKFGVLASYYLPGNDSQAAPTPIDSSVNAFRYVLSSYLGYNLPSLPDCQFAVGDKYNLYTYQLVSGQLKGAANPTACKQYN
jgi:hypothetical protein